MSWFCVGEPAPCPLENNDNNNNNNKKREKRVANNNKKKINMDKSGSVHVNLGIWSMIKDDSSSTKLLSSQWPIYRT